MNMSDDIASSVLQVSTKSVETAAHISISILDSIARLLKYLEDTQKEKNRLKTDVQNKEITEIKSGKVSTKELIEHCRNNHDRLISSENGITKDDVAIYASKAKKCGIPISFRNEKGHDNVYIGLRESDLSLFKQLQTEIIKEKLEVRPQELRNFKCNEWEIPFINAELKKHDLSAQFVKTVNNEFLAVYEAKDAKAIEIARSEFVRKASEIENSIDISKDKDIYTIKDKLTGNEIQVDTPLNRKDISKRLQTRFGYDENKANIAAQKFGHEMLVGDDKKKYFSDDPLSAFTYTSKVTWDKENVMTKAYECYYVSPKEDGISRIVYQDDDGKFAVLNPPRQTKKTMRGILKEQLGISDVQEQNALIAKAEHISKVNAKYRAIKGNIEDLHLHEVSFTKEAFDLSNPEIASNMRRIDENGAVFTKKQPIDSISTSIQRKDTNTFIVSSTAMSTEYDKDGTAHSSPRIQQLVLSFSKKKTALEKLKEMYKSQGVPETAAKEMAKNVFQKAELQSAEQFIAIEEKTATSIVISGEAKDVMLPATNREEAVKALQDTFDISPEEANAIVDKAADDNITFDEPNNVATNSNAEINVDTNINSDTNVDINSNGHERHPEGNILENPLLKESEKMSATADKLSDKTREMADDFQETLTRGGR